MTKATYAVSQSYGPTVEAEVIVSPVAFSPRYDLDRVTGRFSRAGHPCHGLTLAGKALACDSVQGGVAGGWAFLAMQGTAVGPAALVFGETNPVMVQGAVTAGIPIVAGIDPAFFQSVTSGARLRIDPASNSVEILP